MLDIIFDNDKKQLQDFFENEYYISCLFSAIELLNKYKDGAVECNQIWLYIEKILSFNKFYLSEEHQQNLLNATSNTPKAYKNKITNLISTCKGNESLFSSSIGTISGVGVIGYSARVFKITFEKTIDQNSEIIIDNLNTCLNTIQFFLTKQYPAINIHNYVSNLTRGLALNVYKFNGDKLDENLLFTGNSYSLGIAVAYYSYLTAQEIPRDIAITGELDNEGLLKIDDLPIKFKAILERPSIKRFIYPDKNKENFAKVNSVEPIPCNNLEKVLITVFGVDTFEKAKKHFQDFNNKNYIIEHIRQTKNLKNDNIVGRNETVIDLIKRIGIKISEAKSESNIICIVGDAGIGKSQLQYDLLKNISNDLTFYNTILIPSFFSQKFGEPEFYKQALEKLEQFRDKNRAKLQSDKEEFYNLLNETHDNIKILIIADGIDEIESNKIFISSLFAFEQTNILTILSFQETDFLKQKLLNILSNNIIRLTELSLPDIKLFLEYELENDYGRLKFISENEKERLKQKSSLSLIKQKSKGNPLYLDLFVRANKNQTIIDIDNLGDGIIDYVYSLYRRINKDIRSQYLDTILPLLASAKIPLTTETLKSILGVNIRGNTVEIEEALKHAKLFIEKDSEGFWNFKNLMFKQGFQVPEELQNREVNSSEQSIKYILSWCSNWQEHKDSYALEFYADHLYESDISEELYKLAFDEKYFKKQFEVIPDFPNKILNTTVLALKKTLEKENILKVIKFTFLHAKRTQDLLISPINAYYKYGLKAALAQISFVESFYDQQIWRLLISWKLAINNRKDEAKPFIIAFLKEKRMVPDNYFKHVLIALVPHLLMSDLLKTDEIIDIFDEDSKQYLVKNLWQKNQFELAEKILLTFQYQLRSKINREYGQYLIKIKKFNEAKKIIRSLNDNDKNKYWLWCDLALAYAKDQELNIKARIKKAENTIRYNISDNWDWQRCVFWLELGAIDPFDYNKYLKNAYAIKDNIQNDPSKFNQLLFINGTLARVLIIIGHYLKRNGKHEVGNKKITDGIKIFKNTFISIDNYIKKCEGLKDKLGYLILSESVIKYFIKNIKDGFDLNGNIIRNIISYSTQFVWDKIYSLEKENIPLEIFYNIMEVYIDLGKIEEVVDKIDKRINEQNKIFIYKEILKNLFISDNSFDYDEFIYEHRLNNLDHTIAFESPIIFEIGFSNPNKSICILEKRLLKTTTKWGSVRWGESRVLGEMSNWFIKNGNDSIGEECITITQNAIEKINFQRRIYPLCNLINSIYDLRSNKAQEFLIKYLKITKYPQLKIQLISCLIKNKYDNDVITEKVKEIINNVKGSESQIVKKINSYGELLEKISAFNNINSINIVGDEINILLNNLRNAEDYKVIYACTGNILRGLMKSFVENYNTNMDTYISLYNRYVQYSNVSEITSSSKKPDKYRRAESICMAYKYFTKNMDFIGEVPSDIKKVKNHIRKIDSDVERAKTYKDISLLLLKLGRITEALEFANLISTQQSEHLPEVLETYLSFTNSLNEEIISLHIKASQFYDAVYRLTASLVKHKLSDMDTAIKIKNMMIEYSNKRWDID